MRPLAVLFLATSLLGAHTYPVSHGTFTVLPGGARFRLRLSAHHVHPVLERFAGHRLAPKDGEAYDPALLHRYFAERLVLLGPAGERLTFTVVKQELDPTDLVVTLEVLAPDLRGWRLQDRVLMEANPRQKNLVTVEGLGAPRGLTFEAQRPVLPLAEAP